MAINSFLYLEAEVAQRLAELAERTCRSETFHAAEAIADYVERELAIIAVVEAGLAGKTAGRVAPDRDVVAESPAARQQRA